ncbi:glycosyltransferase family 2 protein [Acerihabitans sp. TG2]|uniref:glycosyltransferase family 2 protein n=1 Tax=Acerihabitans sp. TG2 TaxID=3096008 RepID=UPI002B2278D3|nr:glycosyltransferase family 2 protein [Acerihabitans sp. TG2]MEA9389287.1 glycosyltransferase family 2 protein [Acerihabitans sp. TG2]
MDKINRVIVLLSSFNGEKYIQEQIESIFHQNATNILIDLIVRDDGSSDDTKKIISSLKKNNIQNVFSENIGVVASFFELIKIANDDANYYAFSDQDDVWKENKIERAVSSLSMYEKPCMWCSRLDVVDSNLNHLFFSEIPKRQISFNNALVENIVTGCTIVLNRAAFLLLKYSLPDPKKIVMHDWWFYLVISVFGQIIYDSEPSINYRQHNANVEGMKFGLSKIAKKISTISKPSKYTSIYTQLSEFFRIYNNSLTKNERDILYNFMVSINGKNIFKAVQMVFLGKVYRQTNIENLSLIFSIFTKRI